MAVAGNALTPVVCQDDVRSSAHFQAAAGEITVITPEDVTLPDGTASTSDDPVPDLTRPRSLVATTSDDTKRDAILSKCFNLCYDILTILISIADITTDIVMLISFWNSDRMTFFWISLSILITAQIGYVFLFWMSFDFSGMSCIDPIVNRVYVGCNHNSIIEAVCQLMCYFLIFCILLPFSHLVAFLMYFSEHKDSVFAQWLEHNIGITRDSNIPNKHLLSERAQAAAEQMNKHGGFILEAFLEALPQSILQLIAMVYFEETSYIAVGSIILSMTSIMTKSLVIADGLEWKSYICVWLCWCTDFFSVFFVVSWLFLSNEHIHGEFLGYFNIIGEIWCWKVLIAIIPFWAFVFLCYFFFAFWVIIWGIWKENNTIIGRICVFFLFITCGNAFLIFALSVISLIGMLFMEIACCSVLVYNVLVWCSGNRWDYSNKYVSNAIKAIHGFISNADHKNNDRIIRILAVNYAFVCGGDAKLLNWIDEQKQESRLNQVTYSQIRRNCVKPQNANLLGLIWSQYKGTCQKYARFMRMTDWDEVDEVLFEFLPSLLTEVFMIIILPIYLLSRIVTVFYPYFIVGYISYNELWNELNLFELVMLGTYIGLQVMILFLGIFVYRTHLWMWHVLPGMDKNEYSWPEELTSYLTKMYSFYDAVQWDPVVREIVMRELGPDIGLIVWDYVEAMSEIDLR